MHQLLLLRHAKAVRDASGLADRDRPLARRGRRDAAAVRQAMRALGLVPDLILVSPALRTSQTLAALEPWDDTPLVESLDPLYLADAAQLRAVLAEVAETVRSVLLIGHNPGLHELACRLAGSTQSKAASRLAESYPTSALAEFAIPGPWSQSGGARLIRFLTPGDLAGGRE
ncbi:MAG: SixA phosphatase family protein [Acetobacteraceae bacterium]